MITRITAHLCDSAMCAMMNILQQRTAHDVPELETFERYLDECAGLTREEYFSFSEPEILSEDGRRIVWRSPMETPYPENARAAADFYPVPRHPRAPVMFILHALMSANDLGYRRLAAELNRCGWAACFVHLPFHYSRRSPGRLNGELTITAHLLRNAEIIRQAIKECRQLMHLFRKRGVTRFGLWGTSYGGWVGSLLSAVEPDFEILCLMQPIVDIEHVIWESPCSRTIRRAIEPRGIRRMHVARHSHLSSPLHAVPLASPRLALIAAAEHDTVSPADRLEKLATSWPQSQLLRVRQGHFGYRSARECLTIVRDYL